MEIQNNAPDKQVFNMGLAILERINFILDNLAKASLRKDFPNWYDSLIILKKQLNYSFSEDEINKDNAFTEALDLFSREFASKMVFNETLQHFVIKQNESYENYSLFYSILEDYEKFLMTAMNSRDMLTALKTDKKGVVGEM